MTTPCPWHRRHGAGLLPRRAPLPEHSLHATSVELQTDATGMYRVFHWFVLQPE